MTLPTPASCHRTAPPPSGAPHDPAAAILALDSVGVELGGRPILEDVTFTLQRGERIAVVGPNGAGKSTLFKAIAGILRPAAGAIRIGGSRPDLHICIGYLAQRTDVDWTFPVTVSDVVMMGRIGRIGLFRRARRRDRELVMECLDTVGLAGLAKRRIRELSGGQQQRMFIARALAQEAELMLMDEPLTGLDVTAQEDIFAILDRLRAREVTILLSLHDLSLAGRRFDRLLLLNRRVVGFGPPARMLEPALLARVYGERVHLVDTRDGHVVLTDSCCEENAPWSPTS